MSSRSPRPQTQRSIEDAYADDLHPGAVGVEVGEREPFESGVFQAFDVVLDMGVVTHVCVELDWGGVGVGVVTPVAVAQRREQRPLRTLVKLLAAHDQPGPGRPTGEVDEVGDLRDMGP